MPPQVQTQYSSPSPSDTCGWLAQTQGAPKVSLLEFYARKHPDTATYSGWQQRITSGLIRINGATCTDAHATVP